MPTKPSSTFTFGTDANFSSGPATGQPVKVAPTGAAQGFVPGDGIEAESPNYMLNICGQWVTDWLSQGSNAADEDAHIVETDSDGQLNAARANFSGHSVAGPTVTIGASVSGVSLVITGGGSNFGATVSNGGTLAALRASATGTNYALDGLALGTNNTGVHGSGTGSGHGVYGEGGGTGDGVRGDSGVTSGAGVRGTALASAASGVIGIGFAAAASLGVDGQAGHADATGLRGITDAMASASGIGVLGLGQADGVGVKAQAADGYALMVVGDLSAPVRAAVRIAPQDTEPSGTDAEGDLYANSTNNLLWYRDEGGFKALHHSLYGYAEGFDEDVGGSDSSSTEQTAAAATCSNKVTADIYVFGEVTIGGTAGETVSVKIRRGAGTGGTIVAQRTVDIPTTITAAQSISVSLAGLDTSQAAGSNVYQLTVQRDSGSNTVYWSTNTIIARTLGGA